MARNPEEEREPRRATKMSGSADRLIGLVRQGPRPAGRHENVIEAVIKKTVALDPPGGANHVPALPRLARRTPGASPGGISLISRAAEPRAHISRRQRRLISTPFQ